LLARCFLNIGSSLCPLRWFLDEQLNSEYVVSSLFRKLVVHALFHVSLFQRCFLHRCLDVVSWGAQLPGSSIGAGGGGYLRQGCMDMYIYTYISVVCILVFGMWYLVFGNLYFGSWYLVFWYLVIGILVFCILYCGILYFVFWYLVFGMWYFSILYFGSWYFGSLYLVSGMLVFGVLVFAIWYFGIW
jgi:hypothetical protein